MFTHDNIDRIIGAKVIDSTGDKIGSVGQVFLDDRTNEPTWVTVNTGLFGTKETFIPLQGAQQNGDDLQVAYEKGLVKDAPNIDVDNGHLTPEEEAELYRYYGLCEGTTTQHGQLGDADRDAHTQGVAGQGVAGQGVAGQDVADRDLDRERNVAHGDIDATAHEERLKVGTEERQAGQVRIRKYVTTEQQQVSVPVSKERLVVDREPAEGRPVAGGIDHDNAETIDETITLREERPVVGKETVETEHVRIGKEQVTEQQTVQGEVAREHIEVEGENLDNNGQARH